jgi:hypothetical protein
MKNPGADAPGFLLSLVVGSDALKIACGYLG